MANGVDNGATADFPVWGKNVWAISLILGMLAGIVLALNGAGVLTDEKVARDPSGKLPPSNQTLRLKHFLAVYVGFLISVVFLAFLIEAKFGISPYATIQLTCGAIFMAASFGKPWWLYATIRRLGWFAAIFSDKWMRRLLVGLGAILVVSGSASATKRDTDRGGEQTAPFNMSSLTSTYPLVGAVRGTYVITSDSIVVTVSEGELRSQIPRDYGALGTIRDLELRVGLGAPTRTGWALDTLGTQIGVADLLRAESWIKVSNLRFVLPTKANLDLSERWLVFQLSAHHSGLFNRSAGEFASYVCQEENILGATEASRSRAARLRKEYSKIC
jgi:hypothetical protein